MAVELPVLPPRNVDGHKGSYGRALLIGGSRGMSGAPALAGMAAARSGVGLTTVAVPDGCLETVASFDPILMTVPLPHDVQGRIAYEALPQLRELGKTASGVGLGPGLSQSSDLVRLVDDFYKQHDGPLVVDADGLNALAHAQSVTERTGFPRILTPHIGEFRRLLASQTGDRSLESLAVPECRAAAASFAKRSGVVLVLKGHRTIVTDGTTTRENTTGNPGMATGGAGDVLTGVIVALLGQGMSPLDSAVLGVHVHGLAGDFAKMAKGEVSMTACDLIEGLAPAFLSLTPQS